MDFLTALTEQDRRFLKSLHISTATEVTDEECRQVTARMLARAILDLRRQRNLGFQQNTD